MRGSDDSAIVQIEEKNLNEFSLLMFSELTARHSGEYTCRVSNHAAVVNYTATLSVKGDIFVYTHTYTYLFCITLSNDLFIYLKCFI